MTNHDNDSLQMPTINPYLYSIKLFDGHGLNNIVYMNQQMCYSNPIIINNNIEPDIYTTNHLNYIESLRNNNRYQNRIIKNNSIDNFKDHDNINNNNKNDNNNSNSNNNNNNNNNNKYDIKNENNSNNNNNSNNIPQTPQTPKTPSFSTIKSNTINLNSPISFNLNESDSDSINNLNSPKVQLSSSKKKKNRPICKGIFLNGKNCPYASQFGKLYCLAHDPDRQCQAYIGQSRCSKNTIDADSKYCIVHVNLRLNK